MFVINSTVLREVLLIWMPYLSISTWFLKVSPSSPVPATASVTRVASSANSSCAQASQVLFQPLSGSQ